MKIAELIDIGANLTHESFSADRTALIERATAAGVLRMVVTGADLKGSAEAAALSVAYPMLWSTAGIHPHHASSFGAGTRETLLELLGNSRTVAVGECGLDYFRDFSPRDRQRQAFIAQLELAVAVGKPVFLHQRDAHEDFSAILRDFEGKLAGGVAHCFTGGRHELETYLSMNLYIGVTGWVCDERRGGALRDAVPHIPLERLMLETDAPYLLPRELSGQVKGRRNEPALLPHIAAAVAKLRGESFETLAAASTRNAERFFALESSSTGS
jgi:TatD DNase family protein